MTTNVSCATPWNLSQATLLGVLLLAPLLFRPAIALAQPSPASASSDDPDKTDYEKFVAAAQRDIARGKARLARLEKRSGTAATDAEAGIDRQVTDLRADVDKAEFKFNEMQQAGLVRWREFEAGVSAATARLRRAAETATN